MSTMNEYVAGFGEEPGYFDYAGRGPLSDAVIAEARAMVELLSRARYGNLKHVDDLQRRFDDSFGAVTGFRPEGISFQPNTSAGLMHVMFGLSGRVLVAAQEFPSLTYAALRSEQAIGDLKVGWLEPEHGFVTPGEVRTALTEDVTAVALSLVDFRTGYLADIEGIREVIGDRLLILDATQALGVVDAPWELTDVVAAGGYKWLRAGRGTGVLAMSDAALTRIAPVVSGVTGSVAFSTEPFGPVQEPAHDASAFTVSQPDDLAQARMCAALEEVHAVGVGNIEEQISANATRLIELVDGFGLPVVSLRGVDERSGIVVVRPDDPSSVTALSVAMANHGVTATVRDGAVRFSVHAGTGDESFALLERVLAEAL